jgi:hypothetical protein
VARNSSAGRSRVSDHLKIFNGGVTRPADGSRCPRCLTGIRYSDGGGLDAAERTRREQVRLAAAELIDPGLVTGKWPGAQGEPDAGEQVAAGAGRGVG